ncbi:MAG: RiPP maturation radical SAM C-methyltransferase [Caldilineaceae bacterium]
MELNAVQPTPSEAHSPSVLLVSMPWTTLTEPSLGLSLLRAILDGKGIPCRVWHLNLFMLQYLRADTYNALANVFALNDFLFGGVLDPHVSHRQERWLRLKTKQLLRFGLIDEQAHGGSEGVVAKLLHLRQEVIPTWLQGCADTIAQSPATLVGFTCMFDQTIASVALAKLVKQRAPGKLIALGGYAVRSPTADAVMRSFQWIDAVCDGEGDAVIERLALASGGQIPLADVPGIVTGSFSGAPRHHPSAPAADLNALPPPNFDDFFQDVRTLSAAHAVDVAVEYLPLENSRGCWWGAKHHCVFCGIRQEDLAFRSCDADKVLDAMQSLSERYGITSFRFSDYILPSQYYKTLLPELARRGRPYRIISEMKANIDAQRFALLARAGFQEVQPGIESFHSSVLQRMDKGVSAIQNVHTLLLGKRHGVYIHYNLLYGFPGDTAAEYEAQIQGLARLGHLDPPATRVLVQVTRYAPLQTDPQRFGIPTAHYEPSYELILSEAYMRETQFSLDDFCYYYDRPFGNSPRLQRLYEAIDTLVDAWKVEHRRRRVYLEYVRAGDGLEIHDGRRLPQAVIQLDEHAARVYLACSEPISIKTLAAQAGSDAERAGLAEILRRLDEHQLIFREDDRVVALALPRAEMGELFDSESLHIAGDFATDFANTIPVNELEPRYELRVLSQASR